MREGKTKKVRSAPRRKPDKTDKIIRSLVAELSSQDGLVRVRARKSLVGMGNRAVLPLVCALASKKQWVRWEAAKSLGQIGDTAATRALINALEDKMFDVRWLAAEGLISIGPATLVPLLEVLETRADSLWLREGVHHVLHNIQGGHRDKVIDPVLKTLEGFEPSVETPLAARRALDVLAPGKARKDVSRGPGR
jgi:HEAT repeat protein